MNRDAASDHARDPETDHARDTPTDTQRPRPLPIDPAAIDAVVLDIGGVFTVRHPEPLRNGFGRAGHRLPDDDQRFHRAHHVAVHALATHMDGSVNEYEPSFWAHFERAYLSDLGIEHEQLDWALEVMKTEVWEKEQKPIWRWVLEHNVVGFNRMVDAGVPLAIVSNNDGTAAQQMRDFGICQAGPGPLPSVAVIVDSGVLGIAKPDPAIFTPALEALNVPAGRALYVGDTVHADVMGATAAGMPVVQLDPYGFHAHFEHCTMPDLGAVADMVLGSRAG